MTLSVGQRAIVPDASAAVRLVLGEPTWIDAWEGWASSGALILVPANFGHEVANALLRSARIGGAATVAALERLFHVGIETADRGVAGLASATLLADRHRLTIYDAAYLDLALDVDAELATLDDALRGPARSEGVTLIP